MITLNGREIPDDIAMGRLERLAKNIRGTVDKLVENSTTTISRLRSSGEQNDPRRNIYDDCGYPLTEQIRIQHYQEMYYRNPIAKKVVDLKPDHSWQVHPRIIEDDSETETPFEAAVKERLGNALNGESWYQDDEGDPVWEVFKRVDRLSGIGHYGVMLIGVGGGDGEDLGQELTFSPGQTPTRDLIYLKAFPEYSATVKQYDRDKNSPRYGKPEMYSLTFEDTSNLRVPDDVSVRASMETFEAHWTRVIHIADNIDGNEIVGVPRMRPNYNRLLDLDKLYGGSAEMYWRGAFPGISWETHPQLGGDVEVDVDSMKSQMEQLMNTLQRYSITTGMTAKELAPQVVDPTPQITAHIEAICMEEDCPKRIFMGSERGHLASDQDAKHWANVITSRRESYVTPGLIVPTVNRFIQLGILPIPSGYSVVWPEIESMSPLEKADIALKLTQAIVAYVAGNGPAVLPFFKFLTMILNLTAEEADAIIEEIDADLLAEAATTTLTEPPETQGEFDGDGTEPGGAGESPEEV
jgi:hypothetical protein